MLKSVDKDFLAEQIHKRNLSKVHSGYNIIFLNSWKLFCLNSGLLNFGLILFKHLRAVDYLVLFLKSMSAYVDLHFNSLPTTLQIIHILIIPD